MTRDKEDLAAHCDVLVASQRLIDDQREANQRMIAAALLAQEHRQTAEAMRLEAEAVAEGLREMAELREMFIGILGHDLRNPLGSILMTASGILQGGNLDPDLAARISRILSAGERMNRMISWLMDLTRTRLGGGLPIERNPGDLAETCRAVVEEFEGRAAVHLDVQGELSGSWDADRMAEAISNLVGNAVEHAAPGTVVQVTALLDGPDVAVAVSNQGEPIPEASLPSLFDPFRRAAGATPSRRNLGLGLYIAQQIALAHGGLIEARSERGTTTFLLRMPRGPRADHSADLASSPGP